MKNSSTKKSILMSSLGFWGFVLSIFMLFACDAKKADEEVKEEKKKADASKFSFALLKVTRTKAISIETIKKQIKSESGWTIKSIKIDDKYKSFAEVTGQDLKDVKITLKKAGIFTVSITFQKTNYEDFVLKDCRIHVALTEFGLTFKKFTRLIGKPLITSSDILGQIAGDKAGYTIKSIKVSDGGLAVVEGNTPTLQIKLKKAGNFTATIVLVHSEYFDVTLKNCAFEIVNPAPTLSFPSYEKLNNDKNNAIITEKNILAHIPEATKDGYTLKALTGISDSTVAELSGTKQITIKKEDSSFTATIILEKTGYQDVTFKNKSFSYVNIFNFVGEELKGYKDDKYKTSVTKLDIPQVIVGQKITSVGTDAFKDNKNLVSVTFPSSVTVVKTSAFNGCTALQFVSLPRVATTGRSVFSGCTALTVVKIPAAVSIGANTFYKCTSLQSITIPDSTTAIGNSVFSGCVKLANVTVGKKVATIGDHAFNNCKILYVLTVPSSVTAIGKKAFANCTKLIVTIQQTKPANITSVGAGAFEDVKNIKVPRAVLDAYKKASAWSIYASKIIGD